MKKLNQDEIENRNKKEYFLNDNKNAAKKTVSDMALTIMELYNPNLFPVRYLIQYDMLWYIDKNLIPRGPFQGIIMPDSFQIFPHRFYLLTAVENKNPHTEIMSMRGMPINMILNMGNEIGIGNKFPSKIESEVKNKSPN